jgi:hypothetical protein
MNFWLADRILQAEDRHVLAGSLAGEGLDLETILVDPRKTENLRTVMADIVQCDVVVVVEAGIEGRMHRDEALVAVEGHFLPQRHLRGAIEGHLEAVELRADVGIDIGAEGRIALDRRRYRQWFLASGKSRRHRRIDADIRQAAAAQFRLVAHVVRIGVEIGKRALHLAQPADRAIGDQFAHLQPLRMISDHEGLGDDHAGAFLDLQKRLDLRGAQRQRLLDQNVLAGFRRLCRPFDMLRGRQRDIDAIDGVGRQHLLIGAEGVRRAKPVGERAGAGLVAAGNRRKNAVFGIANRRDHMFAADFRRRHYSPSEHRILPVVDELR